MKRPTRTKTNATAAATAAPAARVAAAPAPRTTAAPTARTYVSNGWVDLGSVRERTTAKGDTVTYIVVDKGIEIYRDGEMVNLGEYRTVKLIDPRQGLETALSNGKIDEETYNSRLETLNDKNILFKLTVPPENT